MNETASAALTAWSGFYTMLGSAAAALTGLMFVVITLIFGSGRPGSTHEGIATFSTPTVVHFGAALLVSAILLAPWRALVEPAVLVGVIGLYGLVHIARVMLRTSRLSSYRADLGDWFWYNVIPLLGYGAIFGGATLLVVSAHVAMFGIAGGSVLLIFVGIRNAWDVVTYLALERVGETPSAPSSEDIVAGTGMRSTDGDAHEADISPVAEAGAPDATA